MALASVLGAQWGTFMPYLFLKGFLNKPPWRHHPALRAAL